MDCSHLSTCPLYASRRGSFVGPSIRSHFLNLRLHSKNSRLGNSLACAALGSLPVRFLSPFTVLHLQGPFNRLNATFELHKQLPLRRLRSREPFSIAIASPAIARVRRIRASFRLRSTHWISHVQVKPIAIPTYGKKSCAKSTRASCRRSAHRARIRLQRRVCSPQ